VLALLLLVVVSRSVYPVQSVASVVPEERHPVDAGAWALAAASLLFICATMMIWSFAGAMAAAARIEEGVIGRAVAIGAVAGALTALAVSRERLLVNISVTGLFAGLCLLAPIPGAASGDAGLFILSIVLFNIGSTAIIIRCSGLATARSLDPLFRRLVACTHALGMILGPVTGSVLTMTLGDKGLAGGAIVFILAGCVALLLASVWERSQPDPERRFWFREPERRFMRSGASLSAREEQTETH